MRTVKPGDAFPLAESGALNEVAQAVNQVLGRRDPSERNVRRPRAANIVPVKNADDETLTAPAVVQIFGTPHTYEQAPDEFRFDPCFKAIKTDPSKPGRPAILLDTLPAGGFGEAMLFGVITLKVNVLDTTHRYARALPDDATKLESAATGIFKILGYQANPATTGEQYCPVLFYGDPDGGGSIELVQATSVNTSAHTVQTKSVVLKADLTLTPNYTVNSSEAAVEYPYLAR